MSTTKKRRSPNGSEQRQRRATLRPHPVRDQIVDVMRSYGQSISPTRLSKVTGVSLGSVAYHMRTLQEAGVVELADEGRVRGAVEHFYRLLPTEEEFRLTDPVGTLLGLCGALTIPSPNGDYPRPAILDGEAREELQLVMDRLRNQVQGIVVQADRRVVR